MSPLATSTGYRAVGDNAGVWRSAIYVLLLIAVLTRVAIPAPWLDQFYGYTLDEGGIAGKIHPGGYAIAGVFALSLLTLRVELDRWSFAAAKAMTGFATVIVALMAYIALAGLGVSSGYLIDTYIVTLLGGLAILAQPAALRIRLGQWVLALLVASAAIGILEAVTHSRVMPYTTAETVFRPTGLAGHPLALGLLSAVAIPFAAIQRWPAWLRAAAIAVLFVGTAAANARIALLAAMIAVAATMLLVPMNTRSAATGSRLRALLVTGGAIALAGGVTLLAFAGFLRRLSSGLVDRSSMARIEVYDLFSMASWKEILFGADTAHIARLAETQLGLKAIESSVVIFVFQFGLIGALIFAAAFLFTVLRLVRGVPAPAKVAAGLFFLVALSNNTLSTKTPVILVLIVLLIAARAIADTAAARRGPAQTVARRWADY